MAGMIELNTSFTWPWLAVFGLVTLGLLAASAFAFVGHLSWLHRAVLTGLRFLVVAGIWWCLLDPQWVEKIQHQQAARFAVLLDSSRSMSISDLSPNRFILGKNWLKQRLLPVAPPNVELRYFSFAQSLNPLTNLEQMDSVSPNGSLSGIADALVQLLALPGEEKLTGVILCSDGIENVQKAPEAAAKLFRRKGIPIHTVTLGTTNEVNDVVLENLQIQRAVPNESPTRLQLFLRSPGFAGSKAAIVVLHEKQTVVFREIELTGQSQRVELDFTPHRRGFQVYEARIQPLPGEWLASNNSRGFGVEVIEPIIKVIYMEGSPLQGRIPEWKYLKDALQSDPQIKVKVLFRPQIQGAQNVYSVDVDPEDGEKQYHVEHPTQGYPRTLSELLQYDVIIDSDIYKNAFTADQMKNTVRLVEEFGGGFVMVGGITSFGAGGYQYTAWDKLIPVAMEKENDIWYHDFVLRTPVGARQHPIMALGSTTEETQMILARKMPRFFGYNQVDRPKPGAIVLGEDPTSSNRYGPRVIWAVQEIGRGRTMAFTSDTTRSWGQSFETIWGEPIQPQRSLSESNCDSRYYKKFWINAVRWLAAGKMGNTNNPVSLELAQVACRPQERVQANVKVRDPQLRDVPNAEVSLLVPNSNPASQTNLAIRAAYDPASRSYRASLQIPQTGYFTIKAEAKARGVNLGADQQLLVCEESDAELAVVKANPQLMASLARTSGGSTWFGPRLERGNLAPIFSNVPPVTLEFRRTPLWDKASLLAAIIALLSIEWLIRRWQGFA